MKKIKKKTKKRLCVLLSILIILSGIWYWNNYTLKITEETIISDKVNGEIKVTVISDLHGDTFGGDNSRLIKKIEKTEPDLIFVLGDMYSRHQEEKAAETADFVEKLAKIAETFVITGDHDNSDDYVKMLKSIDGTHYLAFDSEDITVGENKLTIYGIDTVYFSPTYDLNNEFAPPDESRLNILLAHIPQFEYYESFGADLIFCGDSHGGMFRLPFLGGIYFNGYLFPEITYPDEITDKGLYSFGDTTMFVTSGLGRYPLPLRFNNRPEICSITIKGESK